MDNIVTLTPELVKVLRDKVATGEYASEADVIEEALLALDFSDMPQKGTPDFERWIHTETALAYDDVERDPTQVVTIKEVEEALAVEYARLTKAG